MAELAKLIVDLLGMLWPLRVVWTWQRGIYFVCGRAVGEVGPGLKLVVPYFTDVKVINVVPEVYLTPLQAVTLRDGKNLSFSASVTIRVSRAMAAYCTLGHWAETVVEIAAAVLAEKLADAEVERFDPARGKRSRLIDELREEINKVIDPFGLEVLALRMSNFMLGVRTVRLVLDKAVLTAIHSSVPGGTV